MRLPILLCLLLLSVISQAQDCKLIRETDPFTKEVKLSTGFIFVDGGSISFDADSKEVIVLFSVEGADKCFDNNSTAVIQFENIKSKSTSRNGGTMNCEGLFQFVFRNSATTTSLLQKLMTQKVATIVFTGSNKKESTFTVAPAEQASIMRLATCLVNEAKTLIK
ncbi:MAG TPA: hypothetical protein VFV31_03785 [Chitinophagaceae bacterium]|nr:hypothetical protein [Chitinophagaceae bacterium]